MPRNFYLEAQLKEAAAAAGALESALADFEFDVQQFRITKSDEIEKWIETARQRYPHRFALQSDYDTELARSAFLDGNKTSEGRLYVSVGEARFKELKRAYANGEPEAVKKKKNGSVDHIDNPWSDHPNWIDQRGKYNAKAMTKQNSIAKGLGEDKAAEMAASVGSRLGDTGPRRRTAA